MSQNAKPRGNQDVFSDGLLSELACGSENLTSWITHLQDAGDIECLFSFETWLRGLYAFCDPARLPLAEIEKADLIPTFLLIPHVI